MGGGGAEKKVTLLFKHLSFQKLLLLERDKRYPVDEKNIEYITHHTSRTNSFFKTLYVIIYAYKLSILLKKQSCRIISFLERANYVNIISKMFFKHDAIISIECNPQMMYSSGISRIHILLIKYLYPRADKIICITERIKIELQAIARIPEYKIIVIPNTVDNENINSQAECHLEDGYKNIFKDPIIITVGRLIGLKNQKMLLKSFKTVKEKRASVRLFLLGSGPLKNRLMEQARQNKLKVYDCESGRPIDENAEVYFAGFEGNPYKYLSRSKVFVLTSDTEGMPLVIIEAMCCGIPVISTDCNTGPRELLSKEGAHQSLLKGSINYTDYGILIPVGDINALTCALLNILDNDEMYSDYVKRSAIRARDFFYQKYLKEYNKILQQ